MINCQKSEILKARRTSVRRAFNLLELVSALAIIGILATAGITTFGRAAIANGGAEGFARKLSLAINYARRSTIATGDNHYLQLTTTGGNVTSYVLMRRASGGDIAVDQVTPTPTDVTVTSSNNTIEFDFDGIALTPYSLTVAGPMRDWQVSVVMLTGAIRVVETTTP